MKTKINKTLYVVLLMALIFICLTTLGNFLGIFVSTVAKETANHAQQTTYVLGGRQPWLSIWNTLTGIAGIIVIAIFFSLYKTKGKATPGFFAYGIVFIVLSVIGAWGPFALTAGIIILLINEKQKK